MSEKKPNIVIFGDSGSGKSSLVNLLVERQIAKVSDQAVGCTFKFEKYETSEYYLFDTVGLSEGSMGTLQQSDALSALIKLMKSLQDGISALIFVTEKGRIKKTMNENFQLFVQAICMSKVPVILVITHCEMEMEQGQWWMDNKVYFDNYGMCFDAVVSGCCMNPDYAPPLMQPRIKSVNHSTAAELHEAINKVKLVPGWVLDGGWKTWLKQVIAVVLEILALFESTSILTQVVVKLLRCFQDQSEQSIHDRIVTWLLSHGYDISEANKMAEEILS